MGEDGQIFFWIRNEQVHPVNEYELLGDIPAHEENGDEVFSW